MMPLYADHGALVRRMKILFINALAVFLASPLWPDNAVQRAGDA
jgi:hypothetical protein